MSESAGNWHYPTVIKKVPWDPNFKVSYVMNRHNATGTRWWRYHKTQKAKKRKPCFLAGVKCFIMATSSASVNTHAKKRCLCETTILNLVQKDLALNSYPRGTCHTLDEAQNARIKECCGDVLEVPVSPQNTSKFSPKRTFSSLWSPITAEMIVASVQMRWQFVQSWHPRSHRSSWCWRSPAATTSSWNQPL